MVLELAPVHGHMDPIDPFALHHPLQEDLADARQHVFVSMASIIRPPLSSSVQRLAMSFTTSPS